MMIKDCSPQTYSNKWRELEVWVTKEKDKIWKLKYDYDHAYKQTEKIIQENWQNKEWIKKMLHK